MGYKMNLLSGICEKNEVILWFSLNLPPNRNHVTGGKDEA